MCSFFLFCLLPNDVLGAKLLRVELKTADADNANMILGTVDMEIFLPDFTYCRIISLNNGNTAAYHIYYFLKNEHSIFKVTNW